eukprot:scaffold163908_cov15-Prasinocladus_malaysianus.AAC.1
MFLVLLCKQFREFSEYRTLPILASASAISAISAISGSQLSTPRWPCFKPETRRYSYSLWPTRTRQRSHDDIFHFLNSNGEIG